MATRSDARIEFRLSSDRKTEIERAAIMQNRSLTDFAVDALVEAARRVLAEEEERRHIVLSNRDRDRFLKMLNSDAGPNAKLMAAAKRHQKRMARAD